MSYSAATELLVKALVIRYGTRFGRYTLPRVASAYIKALTGRRAKGARYQRVLAAMVDDHDFIGRVLYWYFFRRDTTL